MNNPIFIALVYDHYAYHGRTVMLTLLTHSLELVKSHPCNDFNPTSVFFHTFPDRQLIICCDAV